MKSLGTKLSVIVALLLSFSAFAPAATTFAQTPLRVTFFVNGTLGDKSFFDSAERGLKQAEKDKLIVLKPIETGDDSTKWEAGLQDAMADVKNYDGLVAQGGDLVTFMMANTDKYPDKKFIYLTDPFAERHSNCATVMN